MLVCTFFVMVTFGVFCMGTCWWWCSGVGVYRCHYRDSLLVFYSAWVLAAGGVSGVLVLVCTGAIIGTRQLQGDWARIAPLI